MRRQLEQFDCMFHGIVLTGGMTEISMIIQDQILRFRLILPSFSWNNIFVNLVLMAVFFLFDQRSSKWSCLEHQQSKKRNLSWWKHGTLRLPTKSSFYLQEKNYISNLFWIVRHAQTTFILVARKTSTIEEKEATKQERREHEELKGKLDERREGGPASSSPESPRIKSRINGLPNWPASSSRLL